MLKLDYVSTRGNILPLVGNSLFYLTYFEGQTTANTSISSTVIGGVDGDEIDNIQAVPRTLVLDLQIRSGVDVETAKRAILNIVKLKQQGKLVWTQNERTVVLSGVVESIEMPRWTNAATMQITLHCEQPFWEDVDDVVKQISEAIDLHYFTESPVDMLYFPADGIAFGEYDTIRTKTFHNDGDVSVGLEITILAHDTVTNPIIYDQNGNFFGIGYEDANTTKTFVMQEGDAVVISTYKGQKSVKYNGVVIFDKIKPNSMWLQLEAGDNQFSIDSDDENISNMSFSLIYRRRYI